MAYEAQRDGFENQAKSEDQRNIENNTKAVRSASDVAIASGNPYAMAAGAAAKTASKLTDGQSDEVLAKALNNTNKNVPGGHMVQQGLNKMGESGTTEQIGDAAQAYNAANGKGAPDSSTGSSADQTDTSDGSKSGFGGFGGFGGKKKPSSFFDDINDEEMNPTETDVTGMFEMNIDVKKVLLPVMPAVGLLILFMVIIGAVGGGVNEFDDALGASYESGLETGEIIFEPTSKDADKFYKRINAVKLAYQASGKTVDTLKIAAVYHVLNVNNNDYDYDYMTTGRIEEIASAMFDGNMYSEQTFRDNLTNVIFKKYFPDYSDREREFLTDDVFDYIERYYSFIGSDGVTSCAAAGTCNYDVKGFYIPGAGSVNKNLQINNLMVRLMECGSPYGNGSYQTPIDQELVPFEDYVAGVAYAEIGPSAPIEAIKAQMVAARSFALARPTGMGNSAGKKLEEENGKWILQISSCVADQVFCNINEGCSFMGGGDGQGGICRSGHVPGAVRTRQPLAADHQIRTASAATAGEVLVNSDGYIIQAGYVSTDTNEFTRLAKEGKDYKQILLEVYNSSRRSYGAANVDKMSCNTGTSSCGNVSSGPYASWKQYQGPWVSIPLGNSHETIKSAGCLVTSVAMLIAKSGVPTNVNGEFNPGTFVESLNANNAFTGTGAYKWTTSPAAPSFQKAGSIGVSGYSKQQKLNKLIELINNGYYVVAEVKGNTGQHWVAVDAVAGQTIVMMDPGSSATDMWAQYNWQNTSTYVYFKVV